VRERLTTGSACILLRVGIAGCLAAAAITLAADVSEYPSLNRAGIRALAQGALPLLVLGVLNLVAIDAPARGWRTFVIWLAVAGDVLLLLRVVRFLFSSGAPALIWILGGSAVLLLVGSLGCVVARRAVPPG
jgi:hypothetical protein